MHTASEPPPATGFDGPAADRRVAAVRVTGLLDAATDAALDRLTAMARRLTGAPLAFMTVVDDERSYWLSTQGLPAGAPTQNSFDESFCRYVLAGEPLVLDDVTVDDRTRDNPSIASMGVRAWAGFPVRLPGGEVLGSFCVVDTEVHHWTGADVELLGDLAAVAAREVALRLASAEADAARRSAAAEAARADLLAGVADVLTAGLTVDQVWDVLAEFVVPALGDLGHVQLVTADGDLAPVAAAHRDPGRLAELWSFLHRARRGDRVGPSTAARIDEMGVYDAADIAELSPVAREAVDAFGVHSAASAPVVARGQAVAVVVVARTTGTPAFADGDLDLLARLLNRAGVIVENALVLAEVGAIAEVMQRSLLTEPPQPDHGHIVARYQPASVAARVGGDWYDAFLQPGGTTMLVIGDVAGHDTAAAATMGQLRGLLRGVAAYSDAGPAEVLRGLDASMEVLLVGGLATATVVRFEQTVPERRAGTTRMVWCSAGHPAPVVVHPDGRVEVLGGSHGDLLLGVDHRRPRTEHTTVLERDSTVLLYTDGLVERRDADLDTGTARLVALLEELTAADPTVEELLDGVLHRMVDGHPEDDVALVAVHLHPQDAPRPAEAGPGRVPDSVPDEPDVPPAPGS